MVVGVVRGNELGKQKEQSEKDIADASHYSFSENDYLQLKRGKKIENDGNDEAKKTFS